VETATYKRGKLPIIKPIALLKLQTGACFRFVSCQISYEAKVISENDCELSSARLPSFE
jgi:hypothetical protein